MVGSKDIADGDPLETAGSAGMAGAEARSKGPEPSGEEALDADRVPEDSVELRFAVERIRLRDKSDVPAMLAVSSVSRPDGASSVSRSLAAALAAATEPKVCLLDLSRPSSRPGVVDVLRRRTALDDALAATSNPRLSYLPLGPGHESDGNLLQRNRRLDLLLESLQDRFTYVVLETPPLLGSGEALMIAGYCDASVVVVDQGATTRGELRAALDALGAVRVLGVVMNHVETKVPRFLLRVLSD
jgi:Mrp family chromosome partitioning ATPase